MEVNCLRFEVAVRFFPGFLEYGTAAGVAAKILNETNFRQIWVIGEPFINVVIQKNFLVGVFQLYFIEHDIPILFLTA